MLPLLSSTPDVFHAAGGADLLFLAAQTTENAPDTGGLADFLRGFFGPLFLVIVSIVAVFFLFTREITRFAQFIILAIFIGIVFYVPGIIEVIAVALARAMGVSTE
ncbi:MULTISPECIES: hypothetical protein [Nocardiopsis]|jgi:hypothetical protein|uniref:Uncharacterized protein n=3 Tax=Nocardiopsis TaxID=2013 RepID=D7B732_NOCDD|nr:MULTISPECIES: hypothetical protein [Nocardiopsis]ADH65586.1 conserved hypothetical protein [Nocardiopsis dassonvillei subsp. dassonvillei DSM 43111]APC33943.1 hypothetical protein A9R04_04180 [Nocardiopsis dassonvillei]ASU56805.1 hypothetical protein CGQ36_04285 [Nocardiopsis dassonvillei]MCK9872612.1 hypothetical protein [Nocardiopsis dassonvillei]MCP3016022.1 hypothetical protein [Nocardiopsis dassonvillei]